jgi:hypothetical protein
LGSQADPREKYSSSRHPLRAGPTRPRPRQRFATSGLPCSPTDSARTDSG